MLLYYNVRYENYSVFQLQEGLYFVNVECCAALGLVPPPKEREKQSKQSQSRKSRVRK